jgi:hypothetical protein
MIAFQFTEFTSYDEEKLLNWLSENDYQFEFLSEILD